ncbi:hypothetical protein [Agrobacterium sp. Azo12]|uniref:hypothetical protein n=1 Tax=Agrobacterium sp. Azo12 TaxID=3031129 RepID=UPI0023D7C710|nr:hypothetical protein [Agrobacterium sp. Azo12]MDO5895123.1 hypothetical protein [Agrobacterium sp. Azo12]
MANDIKGEVGFTALGKDWTMKLGNGAVRHVENETGKTFPQIGRELSGDDTASISLLTEVFRASLIRHHPDVTIEDCDDILDEIGHEKAGELIAEAFQLMQPKAQKGGASHPRKATTGSTGRR